MRGLSLRDLKPLSVSAYVETLGVTHSAPTVKQHLAAIRMLFDWLVVGQVLPMNPAASVRGPRHIVKKGKTVVLTAEQARELLDSIDATTSIGLRDRALIGVMVYSFARVSAVVNMDVEDYWQNGKRWWLRLHEKGGKHHEVPAHHNAEAYLDAYLAAAGLAAQPKSPLFRSVLGRTGALSASRLHAEGRPADGKARAPEGGAPGSHLLPHVPRHGHHRLPAKRRYDREGADDRRPRVASDDEALRPDERRHHAG